jgi:hypothetical protein
MCFEEAAMGHCYHHALSSVRIWGGSAEDYLPLHQWFDESKAITADFRHRALRHHAEGIFMLERFGAYASNLDDLVASSGAATWIHGHTHIRRKYRVGGVDIRANCRGFYRGSASYHFKACVRLPLNRSHIGRFLCRWSQRMSCSIAGDCWTINLLE